MARRGEDTEADAAFIAELAAMDWIVTARQLRRWRAADLIPSPIQKSAGRGPGRPSTAYPDGTAIHAAAVASAVSRGVRLNDVVLTLFIEGGPVNEEQVRRAYHRILEHENANGLSAGDRADLVDRAAQTAMSEPKRDPLLRSWFRRSGSRGSRQTPEFQDGVQAMVALIFNTGDPSPEGIDGIAAITETTGDALDGVMETARLAAHLREVLDRSTFRELEQARDLCFKLLEHVRDDLDVLCSFGITETVIESFHKNVTVSAFRVLLAAALTELFGDWFPNVQAALAEYRRQNAAIIGA